MKGRGEFVRKGLAWYDGDMRILKKKIDKKELWNCEYIYNDEMVKGVVDLGRGILAIDAEMHADIEQELLKAGSTQEDLWGINLYPEGYDEGGIIEFDSMINVRPRQGNRTRGVEDLGTQEKIRGVVAEWVG